MDSDGLRTVLLGDDHRLSHDGVGGENRDLRLIDDRTGKQSAERSGVRDREGSSGEFIGSETLRPCSLRDVAYRMRELVQVEEFGASNYGDDETLVVDVDRNPEIYVEMNDEFIVTNRRVESRKVAKRFDGRNRVEGQVTQTEALSLLNAPPSRARTSSTCS